jgi:hypothetical protein
MSRQYGFGPLRSVMSFINLENDRTCSAHNQFQDPAAVYNNSFAILGGVHEFEFALPKARALKVRQ